MHHQPIPRFARDSLTWVIVSVPHRHSAGLCWGNEDLAAIFSADQAYDGEPQGPGTVYRLVACQSLEGGRPTRPFNRDARLGSIAYGHFHVIVLGV